MESSLHPDDCISASSMINELKFAKARTSMLLELPSGREVWATRNPDPVQDTKS